MKKMSVGELKANFSEVLKRVIAGEEIGIIYGRKKEPVAKIVPQSAHKSAKRKFGRLKGKVKVTSMPGFKMTEDEFISL